MWDNIIGTNKAWRKFQAERDAAIAKLTAKDNKDTEYENFVIKSDGVVLVKTCAEVKDIASGDDNLAFTMTHMMGLKEYDVSTASTDKKSM